MKRIDTLIHPLQWDHAREALEALGVRATVREVKTWGCSPPRREIYRGSVYFRDASPELEVTVLVEDARVDATIAALATLGRQVEVLVSSVDGVIHVGEPERATLPVARHAVAVDAPGALRALATAARA